MPACTLTRLVFRYNICEERVEVGSGICGDVKFYIVKGKPGDYSSFCKYGNYEAQFFSLWASSSLVEFSLVFSL